MTPLQWAVATVVITASIIGAVHYLWLLHAIAPELFR